MKLFFSILLVFLLSGCQTIEKKADKIGKEEIKEMQSTSLTSELEDYKLRLSEQW